MKEIANYEGLYAVTSCGRVWSYRKERFLTPRKDGDNLPQINHKDENKQNNCISNLEWCTNVYNRNYGTRNKRAAIGISKAKMKPCMCLETGKTYSSVIEAAKDTNFNKASIKCISNIKDKE